MILDRMASAHDSDIILFSIAETAGILPVTNNFECLWLGGHIRIGCGQTVAIRQRGFLFSIVLCAMCCVIDRGKRRRIGAAGRSVPSSCCLIPLTASINSWMDAPTAVSTGPYRTQQYSCSSPTLFGRTCEVWSNRNEWITVNRTWLVTSVLVQTIIYSHRLSSCETSLKISSIRQLDCTIKNCIRTSFWGSDEFDRKLYHRRKA